MGIRNNKMVDQKGDLKKALGISDRDNKKRSISKTDAASETKWKSYE